MGNGLYLSLGPYSIDARTYATHSPVPADTLPDLRQQTQQYPGIHLYLLLPSPFQQPRPPRYLTHVEKPNVSLVSYPYPS